MAAAQNVAVLGSHGEAELWIISNLFTPWIRKYNSPPHVPSPPSGGEGGGAERTFGNRYNFVTRLGNLPTTQSYRDEIVNHGNELSHIEQDVWHILIFFL